MNYWFPNLNSERKHEIRSSLRKYFKLTLYLRSRLCWEAKGITFFWDIKLGKGVRCHERTCKCQRPKWELFWQVTPVTTQANFERNSLAIFGIELRWEFVNWMQEKLDHFVFIAKGKDMPVLMHRLTPTLPADHSFWLVDPVFSRRRWHCRFLLPPAALDPFPWPIYTQNTPYV